MDADLRVAERLLEDSTLVAAPNDRRLVDSVADRQRQVGELVDRWFRTLTVDLDTSSVRRLEAEATKAAAAASRAHLAARDPVGARRAARRMFADTMADTARSSHGLKDVADGAERQARERTKALVDEVDRLFDTDGLSDLVDAIHGCGRELQTLFDRHRHVWGGDVTVDQVAMFELADMACSISAPVHDTLELRLRWLARKWVHADVHEVDTAVVTFHGSMFDLFTVQSDGQGFLTLERAGRFMLSAIVGVDGDGRLLLANGDRHQVSDVVADELLARAS